MAERLSLRASADLSEYHRAGELVAFNAAADGAVFLLFAERPLDYQTGGDNEPGFAVTQPKEPQDYRVVAFRGGTVELDVRISGERFNIHHVQPLGDQLLLVCARTHYKRVGEHEQNGRLYSREGLLQGEILLGDGIQDVQTTTDGTVWTSYFDEGVFGNFGWEQPLGASGLVAWDVRGTKMFEFEPTHGLDQICDCYALNAAASDDVWLCYYTEFPLVRLRQRRISGLWDAPVRGSCAFAVGSGHCLFQGGYDHRDEYVLVELGSTRKPRTVKRFHLTDETGNVLSVERVTARGDRLHFLVGAKLYALDVATSFAAD